MLQEEEVAPQHVGGRRARERRGGNHTHFSSAGGRGGCFGNNRNAMSERGGHRRLRSQNGIEGERSLLLCERAAHLQSGPDGRQQRHADGQLARRGGRRLRRRRIERQRSRRAEAAEVRVARSGQVELRLERSRHDRAPAALATRAPPAMLSGRALHFVLDVSCTAHMREITESPRCLFRLDSTRSLERRANPQLMSPAAGEGSRQQQKASTSTSNTTQPSEERKIRVHYTRLLQLYSPLRRVVAEFPLRQSTRWCISASACASVL